MKNETGVYYSNGDKYLGEATIDVRNGKGEYTFQDGSRLVGNFVDDKLEGFAEFRYRKNSPIACYEGNFTNNKVDGKGRILMKNGDEMIDYFRESCVIININNYCIDMINSKTTRFPPCR
tara:strand:+ start:214 stop:573 length:360 start_codon:yes stop_codon:yes gene_type:complete